MKKQILHGLFLAVLIIGCKPPFEPKQLENPEFFQKAIQNLSDIVVYDIFSPPVASRVYLYPTIAAYEILAQSMPEKYNSLSEQIAHLPSIPKAEDQDISPHMAALYAFNGVAKELIFSEDKITQFQEQKMKI